LGLPHHSLYPVLEYPAGEITWTFKESDVKGIGFQDDSKIPTSADDWARLGYGYLAIKNTVWDIHGEQLMVVVQWS